MLWPGKMSRFWSGDPWREIEQIRHELSSLFSTAVRGAVNKAFPTVNMWRGNNDVIVTMDVPGVDSEKLQISVIADTLTVSGSREPEATREGMRFAQQERRSGAFHLPQSPAEAVRRAEALDACERLEKEAARLRSAAASERQMARQVDLNLELRTVEAALAAARQQL